MSGLSHAVDQQKGADGDRRVRWLSRVWAFLSRSTRRLQQWVHRHAERAKAATDTAVEAVKAVVKAEGVLVPLGLGFLVELAIPTLRWLMVAQMALYLVLGRRRRLEALTAAVV